MQKNKLSMGYYIKKVCSGTFFSPWRWRSYELANSVYKIFSHLPTGIYQWDDVSNGSEDWAGRKYELTLTLAVIP